MADRKISDLTALTTPATGDLIPIVDVSEAAAADKNKSITVGELLRGAPDGTAAAPGIAFESDPNTGLYSPGADQIAIATAGVDRFKVEADGDVIVDGGTVFVDATNNRVGVGTTSPNKELTITSGGDKLQLFGLSAGSGAGIFATNNGYTDYEPLALTGESISFNRRNGAFTSTQAMIIDSSGRVGIGTSSPSSLLEVDASFKVKAQNTTTIANERGLTIYQNQSDGFVDSTLVFGNSTNSYFAIGHHNGTSYSERVRIDSSGRLGIGTTSPVSILDVTVGGSGTRKFVANYDDSIVTIKSSNESSNPEVLRLVGDNIRFNTGTSGSGTERVQIDSSGRLLVGTSSSSNNSRAVFQGNSADSTGSGIIRLACGTSSPVDGTTLGSLVFADSGHSTASFIASHRDGGTWTSGTSQPTRLVFSTTADGASSPTERMRITKEGNIYFGNAISSTPWNRSSGNGTMSWIEDDGTNFGVLAIANNADRTFSAVYINKFAYTSGDDNRYVDFRLNGAGATIGTITINATSNGVNYNTSSDYRLKENVVALTGGIDRLKQLNVNRFNFISNPDCTVDGFIAHEVQAVVPEAITGEKDAVDSDGNPKYQGIDQSKLVPLLTAALQEAVAKIESLEARLTAAGL